MSVADVLTRVFTAVANEADAAADARHFVCHAMSFVGGFTHEVTAAPADAAHR